MARGSNDTVCAASSTTGNPNLFKVADVSLSHSALMSGSANALAAADISPWQHSVGTLGTRLRFIGGLSFGALGGLGLCPGKHRPINV